MKTKAQIVRDFIESIWNAKDFNRLNEFIDDCYQDYSFLPAIPPTKEGLKKWIENTSLAFDHKTIIEAVVEQDDEVAIRITFHVKHIGQWRNLSPTFREVSIKGFRFFKFNGEKISHHWALIDGEALQTALTDQHHGCEIPSQK